MRKSRPISVRVAVQAFKAAGLLALASTVGQAQPTILGDDPGLARLAREAERLSQGASGAVGVAVQHLESGRGFMLNGDVRFPMASTYKVPIAAQILRMVDQGELSLSDLIALEPSDIYLTSSVISDLFDDPGLQVSIHNLLEIMLQISDNIATDVLMRAAGGSAAVTERMRGLGIEEIDVNRPTWALIANWLGDGDADERRPISPAAYRELLAKERTAEGTASRNRVFNADPRDTSTPEAMARLLEAIWRRQALSEESSALLLDIMYRCQTGEGRIKGLLPLGTRVAHKTGTIGQTTNDVGIIDLPGSAGHLIVVVFIKESRLADISDRERVIAEIARAAHDYFVFNPGPA